MGMSISTGGGPGEDEEPLSAINTTPLVDVMLVLLIIFLITIPVITQSVKVDLPKAANIPTQTKPENINIAVDKDGNVTQVLQGAASGSGIARRQIGGNGDIAAATASFEWRHLHPGRFAKSGG